MTSSLVGSEMCIRDSAELEHAALKLMMHKPEAREVTGIAWFSKARPSDCLLYTSDAADDM
eukprot:2470240-Prorocentrum_lima.AAC.1